MFLSELATLVTAVVVCGGTTLVAGYRLWERFRGKRRNAAARCAYCAQPIAQQSQDDRYYIGGHTVCAATAEGRNADSAW